MRKFLLQHADRNPVSFHMPGHKGSEIFRRYGYGDFLDRLVDCDVTEISGADNLFQAEGIILDTMQKYSRLYEVDRSYLQVNGTSGGILAAILASVRHGGKVIMARNCHKSVWNALMLGDMQPVYAQPVILEDGIPGAVLPREIDRCLQENPDAGAVIITSPNYYGICSDIRAIADVVHAKGKVLIVDQAHGAHLKFFHKFGCGSGMGMAGEDCGADIVINSIHKTLASVTQSALLNLNSNRVDRYLLEDKMQAVETSSPSYILMSFLDINADLLTDYGPQAIREWRENLDYFYQEAQTIPGLEIMTTNNMDTTKINLDMSALGISGARLEELLIGRDIFPELYTGDILMLMTGIGNTREHMVRTLTALREIARTAQRENGLNKKEKKSFPVPETGRLYPVPKKREFVPLNEAAGRISAGLIIPYPPGIPQICPGEVITAENAAFARALREDGEKVIGINEKGEVPVGIE